MCLASSAVFAQTTDMTGKVTAVSRTSITLQKGKETWVIQRSPTTKVSGDLKVGSEVTVTYNKPDAQKKEEPAGGTPPPADK